MRFFLCACVVVAVACVCSVAILWYFIRNMNWDWVHDVDGLRHTLFVPSVRSSVRPSVLFVRWLFCCACLTRNISTQTYVCTDTHTQHIAAAIVIPSQIIIRTICCSTRVRLIPHMSHSRILLYSVYVVIYMHLSRLCSHTFAHACKPSTQKKIPCSYKWDALQYTPLMG